MSLFYFQKSNQTKPITAINTPSFKYPRWGIYLLDLLLTAASILGAFLLRFDFQLAGDATRFIPISFAVILGVRAVWFGIGKTYKGIIYHTSMEDTRRLFFVVILGSILILLCSYFYSIFYERFAIPTSVVLIEGILTLFFLVFYRIIIKSVYFQARVRNHEKARVFIIGSGREAMIAKSTIENQNSVNYQVKAFFSIHADRAKMTLEGVPIYRIEQFEHLVLSAKPDLVLFVEEGISSPEQQNILDIALANQVGVKHIPPTEDWINGNLSFHQIKEVKIEDLLNRSPIQLSKEKLKQFFKGKRVLITGAAGSIGSEIARQMIAFTPDQMVLLDQAETPLHELQLELESKLFFKHYELVIGDILNEERMRSVFEKYRPDYIFHAAAYKHVPLMENNPVEAVQNNVFGTKILADLAIEFGLEKFIFISTDKAVKPSNIMGASKRAAELYIQSLEVKETQFLTTRFGNVLGSSGSVIPRFKKQIEQGGPITVTHPEMTRFFMTIPEACQLVLEAGCTGKGKEVFVFDMGESIKINDLAKKMIRLANLEEGKDISIVYTGLRPGEKLYEELLLAQETLKKTHHPKLMIAEVNCPRHDWVLSELAELEERLNKGDALAIVKQIKTLVPDFKSQNSIYEKLDA